VTALRPLYAGERDTRYLKVDRPARQPITLTLSISKYRRASPSTIRMSDLSAGSSHRNDGPYPCPPRSLRSFRQLSAASVAFLASAQISCSSSDFTRTHATMATATVTACLLAGSSLPAAPTLVPRIVPRLVSIFAGSLISGPIAQDRARRLVARDSKGESQLRRLLDFLQAAYDIHRPSDLHRRFCTDLILTWRASPGLVSSAASRPNGNCNGRAIETILLGREGGGDDTTCIPFSAGDPGRPPVGHLLEVFLAVRRLRLTARSHNARRYNISYMITEIIQK